MSESYRSSSPMPMEGVEVGNSHIISSASELESLPLELINEAEDDVPVINHRYLIDQVRAHHSWTQDDGGVCDGVTIIYMGSQLAGNSAVSDMLHGQHIPESTRDKIFQVMGDLQVGEDLAESSWQNCNAGLFSVVSNNPEFFPPDMRIFPLGKHLINADFKNFLCEVVTHIVNLELSNHFFIRFYIAYIAAEKILAHSTACEFKGDTASGFLLTYFDVNNLPDGFIETSITDLPDFVEESTDNVIDMDDMDDMDENNCTVTFSFICNANENEIIDLLECLALVPAKYMLSEGAIVYNPEKKAKVTEEKAWEPPYEVPMGTVIEQSENQAASIMEIPVDIDMNDNDSLQSVYSHTAFFQEGNEAAPNEAGYSPSQGNNF